MARKNPAAVARGRRGGSANTPAQAEARRENGKKGGRTLLPRPCRTCGVLTLARRNGWPYCETH